MIVVFNLCWHTSHTSTEDTEFEFSTFYSGLQWNLKIRFGKHVAGMRSFQNVSNCTWMCWCRPHTPLGVLLPLKEAVPGPLKRRAGDFNSKRVLVLIGIRIHAAMSTLKFCAQFLETPLWVGRVRVAGVYLP